MGVLPRGKIRGDQPVGPGTWDLKFGGLGMLVFSGSMYRVGHGAFVAEIMGQFGQWEPPKKCA